jgi:hypothetical protein
VGLGVVVGLLGEGTGLLSKTVEGIEHGAVLSVVTGALQWLVLRRSIHGVGWWALISTGASALGAACGDVVGFLLGGRFDVATGSGVAALLTGIGISFLLRRRAVPAIATSRKGQNP